MDVLLATPMKTLTMQEFRDLEMLVIKLKAARFGMTWDMDTCKLVLRNLTRFDEDRDRARHPDLVVLWRDLVEITNGDLY